MRLPRIGLTLDAEGAAGEAAGRYTLKRAYVEAVVAAGGLPVLLPHVAPGGAGGGAAAAAGADVPLAQDGALGALAQEGLALLDGLVVTGGAFDVPPALYGEARREVCGPLRPDRTAFELALLLGALARGLPVLGVCGGMQLLAVARGAALYQDLPADLGLRGHEQPAPKDVPSHPVEPVPGTRLASLVGPRPLMVNSTHHQAVRPPEGAGPWLGLVVSARAPDGVIEAVELDGASFAVGVQWHPEAALRHDPRHAALYRGLVEAAATFASAREAGR